MKLAFWKPTANFEIETPTAKPAAIRKPREVEIGSSGLQVFGNVLRSSEYNSELLPPNSYEIYDKMRKSDGTVKGMINAIKLPLRNIDWRVAPASDDEADVEIADWIQLKLNDMTTDFATMLYQVMLHLDYGSMAFEKVWEIEDGLVVLRKLAPRKPSTIAQWNVDDNGGLKGITQYGYSGSSYRQVFIPVEKLLVFVNDQESGDFYGTSILRPAYKHWYMKDRMYILDAIAKERRAIGIDVGTLKGTDVTSDDQDDLEMALMGLHAHEKQFMIEQDERYTYRIEGLQGRPLPLMDSIEHHDMLILRTMLAEFIALGGSGGSFALSRDKSSFFIMSLNSIAKNMATVFNRHLIKQWVDYNWTVEEYPKLVYSPIETRNMEALSTAVESLERAGFLKPTSADEDSIRDALELPTVRREQEVTGIALNGQQLTAITALFKEVGAGAITLDSARGILKASFPFLTEEAISSMVGGV